MEYSKSYFLIIKNDVMKKIGIGLLFFANIHIAHAQTFAEWFRQNKTQKKYLIEQIAAFQVYLGYLQKGYHIAESGINAINEIKHGDLNLHRLFFTSLQNVNPNVKRYVRVTDIIALQNKTTRIASATMQLTYKTTQLNTGEKDYIKNVYKNLLSDCSDDLDDLIAVVTDGTLTMKDEERIKRIDGIYKGITDKYAFANHFQNQVKILTLQRSRETYDIKTLQLFNHIKP